ncbi:MAG: hypothetical protein ACPL28_09135 [bacterium]
MLSGDSPALVGIVPRKELWKVIKEGKWYHIPVKSIPKNLKQIRYIAFYFPSIFGKGLRFKVSYYALVLNIDT